MKKRGFGLSLFLALAFVVSGFFVVYAMAADVGATQAVTDTLQMMPAHATAAAVPTTVAATPAQQVPQFSLPAQHDAMSILIWVFITLIPCLGWFIDTIMPFLPCKANGILHGLTMMLRAPTVDPQTNTLTVQLNEIKEAIAALKGGPASGPGA